MWRRAKSSERRRHEKCQASHKKRCNGRGGGAVRCGGVAEGFNRSTSVVPRKRDASSAAPVRVTWTPLRTFERSPVKEEK